MKHLVGRLKTINPIIGAALITIVGVFILSSLFHTCSEGEKLPDKGSNIVDTVIKTDIGQCWVSYEINPKRKVFLGNTLEEIINNERVVEVRLIQKDGLRGDFYQLVWTKNDGFRIEKI